MDVVGGVFLPQHLVELFHSAAFQGYYTQKKLLKQNDRICFLFKKGRWLIWDIHMVYSSVFHQKVKKSVKEK